MRLLANENFPLDAVIALRENEHDVTWIREVARGSKDEQVLALAQQENRILITFDKDFGELAFRSGPTSAGGIILFRITAISSHHLFKWLFKRLPAERIGPAISPWWKINEFE